MQTNISRWQLRGFIFVSAFGTLLHFLFELSGGSPLVGIFSAVNESIWEHMKLIFYPMLIFAVLEYKAWGRGAVGFWSIKLTGALLALALIPTVYYLYSGVLGKNVDIINVLIFYVSAAAAFILETKLFKKGIYLPIPPAMAVIVFCVIAALFTLFTFHPPQMALFRDPVSGGYGYIPQTRK